MDDQSKNHAKFLILYHVIFENQGCSAAFLQEAKDIEVCSPRLYINSLTVFLHQMSSVLHPLHLVRSPTLHYNDKEELFGVLTRKPVLTPIIEEEVPLGYRRDNTELWFH